MKHAACIRAKAGSGCTWGRAVTKDITVPCAAFAMPLASGKLQNGAEKWSNRCKGAREDLAPHHFLLWYAQLPHPHPWQTLHPMGVTPLACILLEGCHFYVLEFLSSIHWNWTGPHASVFSLPVVLIISHQTVTFSSGARHSCCILTFCRDQEAEDKHLSYYPFNARL